MSRAVERQIKLPISKAVEIAWKSIKLRLSRSLVVTSGIVLAMAFLMYILGNDCVIASMRQWMLAAGSTPEFAQARADLQRIDAQVQKNAEALVNASSGIDPKGNAINDQQVFGRSLRDIQKELGSLPIAPERMKKLLGQKPELTETFRQWMTVTAELRRTRAFLKGPQELTALMKSSGVPTQEKEIINNRVQTRWLITLALLVAFVGILNAMLMSVTERFREIGTMKCLGALDGFIVKLFLIESMFQGGVGTVAGVMLGLFLNIAGMWSAYGQYAWKMFPYGSLSLMAGYCLLIGILLTVAGAVYPAWRAARMHPIEAMRVEA